METAGTNCPSFNRGIVSSPCSIRARHSTGKTRQDARWFGVRKPVLPGCHKTNREIYIIRIKQFVRAGNSICDYIVVPGYNSIVDPAWDWSLNYVAHIPTNCGRVVTIGSHGGRGM